MSELSRRELARLAGVLLTGAAFGPGPALGAGGREIDVPGGRRLLRRLVGEDPVVALARARPPRRRSSASGATVLILPGGRRLLAELSAGRYRVSAWSRRLGGVSVSGDRAAVRRVVVAPRGRWVLSTPYDTLVATAGGVVRTTSSTLAQRELPVQWIAGARLPADYARFGRALLERVRHGHERNAPNRR